MPVWIVLVALATLAVSIALSWAFWAVVGDFWPWPAKVIWVAWVWLLLGLPPTREAVRRWRIAREQRARSGDAPGDAKAGGGDAE